MQHLSPTTLTTDEQRLILRTTAGNARDHAIISLALGTGLQLAEIVGLNIGDVFAPDGTPRVRVRVRREIAKGGRVTCPSVPRRRVVGAASSVPGWRSVRTWLGMRRAGPGVHDA